jgi:hypothetical protein
VCGDGVANYGARCCVEVAENKNAGASEMPDSPSSSSSVDVKVGGKVKKDRRQRRETSSPLPEKKVEKKASNEGELFDFLLCNYLLLRCGKLGDEQKIMLDELNISWTEHVEKEMGLPSLEDAEMSVESTRELARCLFAKNTDALEMFESMIEV